MNIQIPVKWLQELLALCGPEDHELRERVMASITAMNEQAAGPVVTPEPDTAIKEAMELVGTAMDSAMKAGELLLDSHEKFNAHFASAKSLKNSIESKLRALLATATGLPAQAVDADSLKLLADIRSTAESTIKAGLVDDRELLHTFETIVMTAAKAKRPICGICDSKGFIAFDDEKARGRNGGKWGVCKACTTAAPQEQADARDADGMYYLQDARHSAMVGNCPSFWRPGGNGYTTNLDEAERFTFEDAMKQHRCRETDLPWLCSEVDKLRRPTVDCQYMPRSWDAQRESIAAIAAAKGESNASN